MSSALPGVQAGERAVLIEPIEPTKSIEEQIKVLEAKRASDAKCNSVACVVFFLLGVAVGTGGGMDGGLFETGCGVVIIGLAIRGCVVHGNYTSKIAALKKNIIPV